MCLCVRPQFLNLRARGSDICKPRNNCIAGPNSPLQSQKQLREYKSYLSWFAFYQRGLSGQRSNHAPFCMKGELFTRHFIRLDTTKLQTDADFISCLSMCSDLDKSPCVQNDRTKRTRRAPVSWMGAFPGELHISPTTCSFCSLVFAMIYIYYKDVKVLKITGFGALAG